MTNNLLEFDELLNELDEKKKKAEKKLLNFNIIGDISFNIDVEEFSGIYIKRSIKLKVYTPSLGEIYISAEINENNYTFLGESLSFLNDQNKEKLKEINKEINKEFNDKIIIKHREYENGIVILNEKSSISTELAKDLIKKIEKYSKMTLSPEIKKQIKEKFIKEFNNYIENYNSSIWYEYIKKIAERDLNIVEKGSGEIKNGEK